MTEQKENPPQVSSDVETPIDLREISKGQLAFYLTERAPVPISEFTEECVQDKSEVSRILRDRFRAEINIDATEFLQLTGDARRPVIKAGKPFIKRGQKLFSEGKSLSDKEKYEQAAAHFERAAAIFESIRNRFATVDYVPEKLEKLLAAVKRHHDSAAREAAKESINDQLLRIQQHESDGDQNTERKPSKAADEYQKALNALSEAIETALQYNQSRLQSDGIPLSVEPLKEERESIKQKLQSLEKDVSGASKEKVNADSNVSSEPSPSSSDSDDREAMLEVVRESYNRLGRIPRTIELPEECKYTPNDFYSEFGSWDETLEAAGIDKEQALLEDIERVAEKLGRVPTSTDMSEYGAYTTSDYSSHFDSWNNALEQSGGETNREEMLLETIRSLHDRLDRLPKGADFHDETGISQHDYIEKFGSWDEALDAAGIDKEQALLEDIERVAKKLGQVPTTADIKDHGTYSSSYYLSNLGSWDAALEQAGVKQEFRKKPQESDQAKLLKTVKSLHDRLGRVPKASELPEECEYSQHDYRTEFGSWDEALEAAGLDREGSMLENIERVAEKLGHVPSSGDMEEHGNYSSGDYSTYFDSWSAALERAGIRNPDSSDREAMLKVVRDLHKRLGRIPKTTELPEECEYSPNDFYSEFGTWNETLEAAGIDKEQALLDDIEQVAQKLGRVPTSTDMDEHGTYSGPNYSSYFDSWSTALEQSGVDDGREEPLLETLRSLHDRLDRLPKTTDLHDVSGISQHDYIRSFGSWDEALEATGIDKQQHLIDDLKQVAAEVSGKPGTTAVNKLGKYSSGMHQKYFGSWDAALEAAGLSSMRTATRKEQGIEAKSSGTAVMAPSTAVEDIMPHIDSVGPRSISRLQDAGYATLGSLYNVEPREIAKHRGIGRKKAIELVRFATENVSKERAGSTEQSGKRDSASTSSNGADATSGKRAGSSTLDPDTPIDDIEHRVDGVGHSSISAVKKAGYNTLGELCDAQVRDVTKYKGIGKTKAQILIQFATENVSTNGVSSGQSSKPRSSTNRSSSSTTGMRSDRIQPSALDSSWKTIPPNERIDGQFLLQVTDVDQRVGDRKTARLDVRDQNGRAFGVNIWSKHNVNREWSEGEWYALENARGKVWESSDGTTRKNLSSTKDFNVIELGAEFNSNVVSAGDRSGTESKPQQPGVTTDEDVSESTPDSTTSGRDTVTTVDDGESDKDDSPKVDDDGVLDDIMSDFDEI